MDKAQTRDELAGEPIADTTARIVGYRLRRAQISVFQRFTAVFEPLDLRPAEYTTLVLIADNPGRKQTDIADALGIKHANFVALLHAFESRGLIERRPATTDRRVKALHLTPKGEEFLQRARTLHDEMEAEFVDRLGGPEARDTLVALLKRLA